MKINEKNELGKIGEQIAAEYIEKLGYKIIKRNFYCKQGEIDIIAQDNQEIVFIEVKTRTSTNYGRPSEAINKMKLKHMYRSAKYYLYKSNCFYNFVRFDVVEILFKDGKFNVNYIKQII